jgi:hypothetical protein
VTLVLEPTAANAITSIYCELADQYKLMDGTSNVAKRNVLAEHLTEVIRVLEKKVNIFSLWYLNVPKLCGRVIRSRVYMNCYPTRISHWNSRMIGPLLVQHHLDNNQSFLCAFYSDAILGIALDAFSRFVLINSLHCC